MQVAVIVGTAKGGFVFRSGAERRDWEVAGPLFLGWKVTASARAAGGRTFVATSSFVYGAAIHCSDDLRDWRQIERGPAYPEGGSRKLTQIWTLHTGQDRYYAGVDTAGLFHSDDRGESWHPIPGLNDHPTRDAWVPGNGGLCAHTVVVDPRRPERVWCGISAVGVWRSDDGGETWHARNDGVRCVIEDKVHREIGFCIHALAQDPDRADTIWRQDHTGMYRTRDGGDHWEPSGEGLPSGFGFPVAIDRRSRALYAFPLQSDEYRMPVDGRFRVYRSRDGGDSWEALSRGLPEAPSYAGVLRGAMATDSLDPGGVYVGSTAGRLHVSTDGGDHWRTLPPTLPRILSVEVYVEE